MNSPVQGAISLEEFLDSCTRVGEETALSFENLGDVQLTTVTRANLALLQRARELGYPGIIFSCPDFERESVAITFLASFQNLLEAVGDPGLHEPVAGEKVAVGDCVVEITEVSDTVVKLNSRDQQVGYIRDIYEFPMVHRAAEGAGLSKTKGSALKKAAAAYDMLQPFMRRLLDMCGKAVPAIGYVSSPSQYLNEPPTHILNGGITTDGVNASLSRAIPIYYVSPNGKMRSGFEWPFEAPPSIVVGPRPDGIGSAYPIIELARNGMAVDFVSLNIPSPDTLETTLLSDMLELVDMGIGVVGFCDRWTLDRMDLLKEKGFLIFDWDDCEVATRAKGCLLSPVQRTMLERQHEKVMPVQAGESGLARAKGIIYDRLDKVEMYTDDAWRAKQDLFRVLGAAIRMTEAPDDEYCDLQRDLISASVEAIEVSRSLEQESFNELCEACDILSSVYEPGKPLPKEQQIYELITDRLDAGYTVVLVVDSNRTKRAYEYWRSELEFNDYSVDGFRVINTRDFMAARGIAGNECVIFSGWYDRGVMDRAVHSGISADMTFVLYTDGKGGLELEWWRRANEQWHIASDRCSKETDRTLSKLGIEPIGRPTKSVTHAKASGAPADKEKDGSPAAIITEIERRRLQKDVARKGEKSVAAIPVMFNDGTHVWLRSGGGASGGGRLVVITDCLDGQNDEPERKPASALLPGDVVLRTHSDRAYIRKASEKRVDGYKAALQIAHRWKEPISKARMKGMSDAEIVERIQSHLRVPRSTQTVRGWVKGERIAPQSEEDIRSIFSAFRIFIKDEDVKGILGAASLIRGQHQRTGMMAHEKMVGLFLDDVSRYGLDDAVSGFDDRHESGNVELLRITAIGDEARVAVDRAYVV
jgi:hypothetical protein